MIKPLPVSSLARLTVLPGEFSTRQSRSGMGSPTLTATGAVVWKEDNNGRGWTAVAARGMARHQDRAWNMA